MKNITIFLPKNFYFLVVKFSIHLNRHVFVMTITNDVRVIKIIPQLDYFDAIFNNRLRRFRSNILKKTSQLAFFINL